MRTSILLFLLSISIVSALDFVENFDDGVDFSYKIDGTDETLNISDRISTQTIASDYVWQIGSIYDNGLAPNANITYKQFWGTGRQIKFTDVAPNNMQTYVVQHNLDNNIKIYNSSYVEFTFNNTDGAVNGGVFVIGVMLVTTDDECQVISNNNPITAMFTQSDRYDCGSFNLSVSSPVITPLEFNTETTLRLNFTQSGIEYHNNIDRIVLFSHMTTSNDDEIVYLDSFGLYGVASASDNEYPSLDYEVNVSCLNDTFADINATYFISASDPEGDTILFSTLETTETPVVNGFRVNDRQCIFYDYCENNIDYDYFDNLRQLSGNCNFTTVTSDINSIRALKYEDIYHLGLTGYCSGDAEILYEFDEGSFDYMNLLTDIKSFSIGDELNITFYDPGLNEIIKTRFVHLDNRTLFYDNGTLTKNITGSPDNYDLDLSYSLGVTETRLIFNGLNISLDSTLSDPLFIAFSINDGGVVYIEQMLYNGIQEDIVFDSLPSEFDIVLPGVGFYTYNLYLTDDIHEPSYRLYPTYINVLTCTQELPGTGGLSGEELELAGALKNSFTSICEAFNGIETGSGLFQFDFDWCWIWRFLIIAGSIFMGLMFFIIFKMTISHFAFPVSILIFSLGMWVGNTFIVDIGTNTKIIVVLLFAISLIRIFIGFIAGGSGEAIQNG